MSTRIQYQKVAPGAVKAMAELERYVKKETELDAEMIELVKLRASQMNGCAYCVDMHTKDARAMGMDEQRLHLLTVWREAHVYSDQERAALAWTEAVTNIGHSGVGDELFEEAREFFSEKDLVDLTIAVIAINGWNRLAITFRPEVGSYEPAPRTARA